MNLRPYQRQSIDAVNEHLATREDNPCVVLPTAAGKSLVMATLIREWKAAHPPLRVAILAHRKELVEQNAAELETCDPGMEVGIFQAAIGRRDVFHDVLFAGIDSIYDKAGLLKPFDVLIIDEAHRIPARGEGKYRRFITEARKFNPNLRVVGLTATPYRMGTGTICHKDHILNQVCYEASVRDLMDQGYLCPLITIETGERIDLSEVRKSAGDFNQKQLAEAVDKKQIVQAAVEDMVARTRTRKSIIVFCINVEHCRHVAEELDRYGIKAPYITGKTPKAEREELVEKFKDGRIRWLLSVNVFFEGFNAKRVDCVVMLRPTQSKGLWVQAVGRGLRLHETKDNCLVLDYGQNIERHGPIDIPDMENVRLHKCHACENIFSRAIRICPACGAEIPPQQQRLFAEAEQRERKMHDKIAFQGSLVSSGKTLEPSGVTLSKHKKDGSPDSVKVTWQCGLQQVSEWICPDHPGFAGRKGVEWLHARNIRERSTEAILGNKILIEWQLKKITKRLHVEHDGKYLQITGYDLEQ